MLARAFSFAAAASVVLQLLAIARSKSAALLLGPAGVGLTSYLLQMGAVVAAPIALVTGPGLARAIIEGKGKEGEIAGHAVIATYALGLVAGLIGAGVAVALVADDPATLLLLGAAAGLGTAASMIFLLAATTYGAIGDPRGAAIVQALGAALLTTGAIAGAAIDGERGFVLGGATLTLLGSPLAVRGLHKRFGLSARVSVNTIMHALKRFGALGLATLAASSTVQLGLLLVRTRIATQGSEQELGHFHAAFTLAAVILSVFLSGLGTSVLPAFAAAEPGEALRREMARALTFFTLIYAACAVVIAPFASLALTVLFSSEFAAASEATTVLLSFGALRFAGWVLAGALMYRNHPRDFAACEITSATIALALVWLLPYRGPVGVAFAIGCGYLGYAILALVLFARRRLAPMPWAALALVPAAAVVIAFAARLRA